jgi:beta-glucosidase
VTSKAHSVLARELAAAATVLLKNEGTVLPIRTAKEGGHVKTIAVIGENGGSGVTIHGGGSGTVNPMYVVTPFEGLEAHYSPKTQNCTFVNDTDYFVTPSTNIAGVPSAQACCDACFAEAPACEYFTFTPPSGCWLHPPGGKFVPHTGYVSGSCFGGGASAVNVTYDDGSDVGTAAALAAAADVAIVFVGTSCSEGSDRANLSFPAAQDALVGAVAKAAPGKTVVVAFTPGAALMPWASDVSAILTMFMPGLEVGNALADVLSGDVNPTARLPLTFPNVENEVNFSRAAYPGVNTISVYEEKLEVGYRWYGAHGVVPRWPFGHGLSYTRFAYSKLQASASAVSVDVANTGRVAGAEVAQLYLGFPKTAGEPPRQLKGFQKTAVLHPGETATVRFPLSDRDLSIWDDVQHRWAKQAGTFQVFVGASSGDVRLTSSFSASANQRS